MYDVRLYCTYVASVIPIWYSQLRLSHDHDVSELPTIHSHAFGADADAHHSCYRFRSTSQQCDARTNHIFESFCVIFFFSLCSAIKFFLVFGASVMCVFVFVYKWDRLLVWTGLLLLQAKRMDHHTPKGVSVCTRLRAFCRHTKGPIHQTYYMYVLTNVVMDTCIWNQQHTHNRSIACLTRRKYVTEYCAKLSWYEQKMVLQNNSTITLIITSKREKD